MEGHDLHLLQAMGQMSHSGSADSSWRVLCVGSSGLGFTATGFYYSITIFWVNSNNFLKLAASLFSSALALHAV